MVQIAGTYELVSQENYKEYLVSLGVNDEQAEKFSAAQGNVVITAVEADKVTVEYGGHPVTFPLNKEHEHNLAAAHKVWTTTTLNEDGLTFKTKLTADGSVGEEKVIKVTDTGLTSTSTNTKGVKSVRHYKRV